MTHNASTMSETEEIEFTAAYGTAVALTGKRQPAIRSHPQESLEMPPPLESK